MYNKFISHTYQGIYLWGNNNGHEGNGEDATINAQVEGR